MNENDTRQEVVEFIAYLCEDCPPDLEAYQYFVESVENICMCLGWLIGKGFADNLDECGEFLQELTNNNPEQFWSEVEYINFKKSGVKVS